MVPKDEIKESPLESACFDVPNVCRELLPYKYTSRFLPTLSNIEFASMNSSTHTCIEDSGKSLNDAFVCFLKYPVIKFKYEIITLIRHLFFSHVLHKYHLFAPPVVRQNTAYQK